MFALNRAMGAWRKWNIDAGRHEIELIPPADYLRMSYYEKWFAALIELLVKKRPGDARGDRKRQAGARLAKATPAAHGRQVPP